MCNTFKVAIMSAIMNKTSASAEQQCRTVPISIALMLPYDTIIECLSLTSRILQLYVSLFTRRDVGGFNTITHSLITDHCNGIALFVTGKVMLR